MNKEESPMSEHVALPLNDLSSNPSLTPPIRSVAADASSSAPSENVRSRRLKSSSDALIFDNGIGYVKQSSLNNVDEKQRDRSTSSTSSSSSDSDSFSVRGTNNRDDDDGSSNDSSFHQLDLTRQPGRLLGLLTRDSLSSLDEVAPIPLTISECEVCLEERAIRPLSCCSSLVCRSCLYSHLTSNIVEARIRIICPSCSHIFSRDEILSILSEYDDNGDIAERYKRFYADINREAHIKTCPRCCTIKEMDKRLFEGIGWRRNVPRRVICDECRLEWCFLCHAPWHEKMTCKEYREGEKMLKSWAAQVDQNQQNAQQCPRCKVFISRNGGCPHMVCAKCHCDFCYNCGKRRWGIKFLGSHESRFSPFGCKYNLYPDKPVLRHTVRGLVAGAATLAIPVAAVGAVALLAVGTTIGAPTYGTYRLVKHIRGKRQQRRRMAGMSPSISSQEDWLDRLPNVTDGAGEQTNNDEDLRRAIEASLQTFREEQERISPSGDRTHPSRRAARKNNDDDDDDD